MHTVFIDGQEGTTGLKIRESLNGRTDFTLLEIEPSKRKDDTVRRDCLLGSDIAILCLPDDAARQAYEWVKDHQTRLLDASTAHRTAPGWAYGLAELSAEHRNAIRSVRFVANPGCHATAFLLGVYPLIKVGVVPTSYPMMITSVTGYSGGGKKLIAKYEQGDPELFAGPRPYALGLRHKHLPEMQKIAGLDQPPGFLPILGPIFQGMSVATLLHTRLLNQRVTAADLHETLAAYYAGEPFVRVLPFAPDSALDEGQLITTECNHTNRADILVFGHEQQAIIVVRLDNLGKGASGAAVQNLNLMLGQPEATGLTA